MKNRPDSSGELGEIGVPTLIVVGENDGVTPVAASQDLNRRIGSVTNTRKITRAMEMVAAAKLRRAQDRIQTFRPFADTVKETLAFYQQQTEERKSQLRAGLSPEREAQVLAAWKAQGGK